MIRRRGSSGFSQTAIKSLYVSTYGHLSYVSYHTCRRGNASRLCDKCLDFQSAVFNFYEVFFKNKYEKNNFFFFFSFWFGREESCFFPITRLSSLYDDILSSSPFVKSRFRPLRGGKKGGGRGGKDFQLLDFHLS